MVFIWLVPLIFFSVVLIWKGSDWITDSLIPVAQKLGTSYVAVTTLLVSFMLSVPELFIAIYSYLMGHYTIGIGVLLGSVLINIGLTVGLSATLKPLHVDKSVVVRDGIFLVIIAIIIMVFGSDLSYSRSEGIVLVLLFIPYMLNVWYFETSKSHEHKKKKVEKLKEKLNLIGQFSFLEFKPSLFTFLVGSGILLAGSYLFAFALVELGELLPISGILVGLIFGAIGTGAPNIGAAISGTLKGYKDAAITETFGSNIFTLLVTLGIIIIINPFTIDIKIFYFDLTWMIMIHLLFVLFILKGYKYREESITRYEGLFLVVFYLLIIIANAMWI
jgi:cation:H+ antiporter